MIDEMQDTIAAISTGMTHAGIGIVRISGSRAIEIGDAVFKGKTTLSEAQSHTIHYGMIVDHGDMEDEVLVSVMRAPRTFTGEDTVEINCHGGVYVMKKVLELVIRNGARAARPGEFSKRSFLNGKMDLSRAEAVMDLIRADSEYALKSSVSQLKGSIKKEIDDIRKTILYETAYIESALDDPEHISFDDEMEHFKKNVEEMSDRLKKMIDSYHNGKIVKEGIRTLILGKPNAGKSSLLNALSGTERAIVTHIEGTTRDILEEQIRLDEITLNLIDTAGIRNTADQVEQIGIERAIKQLEDADLVICVIDGEKPLDENDNRILSLLKGKKAFVLINKIDAPRIVTEEMVRERIRSVNSCIEGVNNISDPANKTESVCILPVSAKSTEGLDVLSDLIKKMFFGGNLSFNEEVYISNTRQLTCLKEAYESLRKVDEGIRGHMPEDFLSIDLMDAYTQLGMVTGETVGEDLVNEIFGRFCMGK